MSIVRVIVVDPEPRDAADDLCIYQVPEKSRAHELLVSLCEKAGLQFVTLEPSTKRKPRTNLACVGQPGMFHSSADAKNLCPFCNSSG